MNPIVGSSVTLQGTFRDSETGALYDPDDVILNVLDPLGTVTSPVPDNPSTGIFEYQLLLDVAGMWLFQFVGTTDDLIAIAEGQVCAAQSIFAGASA